MRPVRGFGGGFCAAPHAYGLNGNRRTQACADNSLSQHFTATKNQQQYKTGFHTGLYDNIRNSSRVIIMHQC